MIGIEGYHHLFLPKLDHNAVTIFKTEQAKAYKKDSVLATLFLETHQDTLYYN
jgi:hypothetical protein